MARILVNNPNIFSASLGELINSPRVSCDTETKGKGDISGLHPFHGARAFSVIFANAENEYYFDFNPLSGGLNPDMIKDLQAIFDVEDKIIFFVNAIFDATILHFHGIKIHSRIIDCPSIARVEFNLHDPSGLSKDESFLSMEYLAGYYEVQLKNDLVKKYINDNDVYQKDHEGKYIRDRFNGKKIPRYDLVPIDLMFEYGCDDARTTFDLGTKILKCINFKDQQYKNPEKMIEIAKNEVKLTSVLIDMKIDGMRHNFEYTQKAIEIEQKISDEKHEEIERITGGINLNSPKQVADFLVSKGVEVPRKKPTDHAIKMAIKWQDKLDILKKQLDEVTQEGKFAKAKTLQRQVEQIEQKIKDYKLGNYKTDKKMLAKLVKQHPELDFISKITEAKEADKKLNTYYKNFMKLQDEFGIIHCGLNQEKTITGRFSSSDPNLQNLEKVYVELNSDELSVRNSFCAFDGYRLFMVDYDQQEMILMLDQSEEMGVIEKLLSGEYEDFYLAVKAIIFEMLGLEFSRYDIKQIALALAYGLGLEGLGRNLGIIAPNADKDEIEKGKEKVKEFKLNFFSALKKLKRLQKRLESDVKNYGKIHNAMGRVIYMDKDLSYKALNAYVQSTAADVTKKAMVLVHERFKKAGLESKLSLSVHDELIFNVKIGEESKALPIIEQAMREAYPCKHIGLGVGFDYGPINKYGLSTWGEKTEWKEN